MPTDADAVTLKLAEISHSARGVRVFHVDLEGQRVLTAFDILAEVAPRTALDKSFTATVTDGRLDLAFTTVSDAAKVSAIEVIAAPAVPASPTATASGPTPPPARPPPRPLRPLAVSPASTSTTWT